VVTEVAVQEGQSVQAGELLFKLDDRELQALLAVRNAERRAAQANLERVENMPRPEEIPPSEARVRKAQEQLQAELDLYQRREKLSAQQMVSAEELISRRQSVAVAREQLAQAQAEHDLLLAGAWSQDKEVARAEVARAQSLVEQTKTDLARLEVRAPVSGRVLKVYVRPGEYVGTPPGAPLVVIGDVSVMHVRVQIDEQDLPRFRPGLGGKAFVRGDATRPLELAFVRVEPLVEPKSSLTGATTERVDTRVLEAVYALPAGLEGVYVGQQLDVFIEQSAADGSAATPEVGNVARS
jgi:multidrug resistance efflux pump